MQAFILLPALPLGGGYPGRPEDTVYSRVAQSDAFFLPELLPEVDEVEPAAPFPVEPDDPGLPFRVRPTLALPALVPVGGEAFLPSRARPS